MRQARPRPSAAGVTRTERSESSRVGAPPPSQPPLPLLRLRVDKNTREVTRDHRRRGEGGGGAEGVQGGERITQGVLSPAKEEMREELAVTEGGGGMAPPVLRLGQRLEREVEGEGWKGSMRW